MIPPLLTRSEAATYLGRSVRTFDAEVAAGIWPPAIRLRRKLAWDKAALDRIVDTFSGIDTEKGVQHEATKEKIDELFGRPWPSVRREAR